ncbi:MAG: hypothetical protein GY837_18150 [Bosea sp.]|uniref:hypothetical protein n=1 Tax=Bosea sp. (in: a-proteobacteria) TaxID=1871050 RepID=UPI0031FE59D5|nr:hypothetical protein [Bosea sp. (in: a-proteobacteria)]
MTGPSLIVPISVEALCVSADTGAAGPQFRGATAVFSDLPSTDSEGQWSGKPYLGDSVGVLPQSMPEAGIHLHWALPDALTKGRADEAGGLTFPPVPNRWLVVRIVARKDAARHPAPDLRAWVVESDFHDPDPSAATVSVPFEAAEGGQFHRFLGRCVDLAGWSESPGRADRFGNGQALTAVGYGEVSFAAYYPNCRNVFGFHDPLDDLDGLDPAGGDRVSYLVASWFADAGLEPFGATSSTAKGLAWDYADRAGARPGRTICSGMIRGIVWDPSGSDPNGPAKSLEIALGNTETECVSALLARRPGLEGDEHAEFLLDAAQSGMLADHWGADQTVKLEHALHSGAFASLPGETMWQVAPTPSAAARSGAPRDEPPEAPVPLSAGLAARVAAVNAQQRAYERACGELASRREALVFDWRRFMQVLYGVQDESAEQAVPELADARQRGRFAQAQREMIEAECAGLGHEAARIGMLTMPANGGPPAGAPKGSLAAQLADALRGLREGVHAECGDAFLLKATPGARFWEPLEPVILLAGEDARPPQRYGSDSLLACRWVDEIRAELQSESNGTVTAFAAQEWLATLDLTALPIAPEARALLAEAILTDPDQATRIAAVLTAKTGARASVIEAQLHLAQADAVPQPAAGPGLRLTGRPAAPIGLAAWSGNPWLPLFLDWEVEYAPMLAPEASASGTGGPAFAADILTSQYQLDADGVELVPRQDPARPPRTPTPIAGVGLLTQSAFRRLTRSLSELLAHAPDDQLRDAIGKASEIPALSHVLNGFNSALQARQRSLQLRVLDPFAPDDELTRAVAALAPARDDATAMPFRPFLPLRGGYLKITRLALIDAFGQERSLDPQRARLARARSLMPVEASPIANGLAHLPPRLVQPARLNFRLLDARNDDADAHDHPSASPICGWVVVNNLDPGLSIHAADGAACGMLRLVDEQADAVWEPPPGVGANTPIADVHLAAFVRGVLDHPDRGAFLAKLAHTIDRTLATIVPDKANTDEAIGLLFGRPLALVRAALSLELSGAPSSTTGWDAVARQIRKIQSGASPDVAAVRDDLQFTRVKVPVRLGNLNQIEDGLVGYFLEGANGADYGTFYAPVAQTAGDGIEPATNRPVLLALADPEPARVTLLMDPFATVHATSGILPVKAVDIPPPCYSKALASLEASFLCNPMLVAPGPMQLPLPPITGFSWSWIQAEGDGWSMVAEVAGTGERPRASYSPLRLVDGWLRLAPKPAASDDSAPVAAR